MAKKTATEKKTAAKNGEAAKPMPKTAVYRELASRAGLEPGQVAAVFDALEGLIKEQLGKKGPGLFAIGNLIKLKLVKTPARKAGKRPNPFKPGEMMDVKARPASVKVKPVVLKGLRDLQGGK
jgi:hypothetical protein